MSKPKVEVSDVASSKLPNTELLPYTPPELNARESGYSEQGFWDKLRRFARKAGREVVEKSLWLYYAYQRPDTPLWAKRVILGALAYFILPLDLIADFLPGIGFTDDLGALMTAISTVAMYINDAVKERARQKTLEWFGEELEAGITKQEAGS
jgi:uncharacterized membrane protein YkvA (DUF1232 family)